MRDATAAAGTGSKRRLRNVAIAGCMTLIAFGAYASSHARSQGTARKIAAATTDSSQTSSGVRCVEVSRVEPKLIPTPGFDPLTASSDDLQAHDFPPRPADARSLAAWKSYAMAYLAGQVTNCATPAPGNIPAELSALQASSNGPPPPTTVFQPKQNAK